MEVRRYDEVATTAARRRRQESGAGLAEYALLVTLIAVVAVGAVALLGQNIQIPFTNAAAGL